jgi:hypothetical protein
MASTETSRSVDVSLREHVVPPDSHLRHPPAPFRYPLPQEVEWRMLVSEAAHARAEGWDCAPGLAERAADAGERMLIAEAQATAPVSRWALGLGAPALLVFVALVVVGLAF